MNLDSEVISTIIENGTSLATLIGSGTVTAITAKINGLKGEKNADKIRAEYDEIITKILQERADAILLAQKYKSELDRIEISEDDMKHLQNTISKIIDIIKEVSPNAPVDTFKTIKDLITVDTLKTMQLLGFNYKAAIGEPLTELCSDKIRNLSKNQNKSASQNKKSR